MPNVPRRRPFRAIYIWESLLMTRLEQAVGGSSYAPLHRLSTCSSSPNHPIPLTRSPGLETVDLNPLCAGPN
jgi:hypothetical protein